MFKTLFSPEGFKATVTILILLAALYSFVREKLAPDVTGLLALLALLLTGVLTPVEAFSGFSHPATVSVAAVLVLSAGIERTGALNYLARRFLAPLGKSEFLLVIAVMLVIGLISAFINNTAAVAIFIPIVIETCRRTGASPGRVLMPMSHAATMGGMCTLIGTSTNLVAHEYARSQGLHGFSMFELGKVGLPMVLVGFGYMLLVGRWFLPRNRVQDSDELSRSDDYLAELLVHAESKWIGREARPDHFQRDLDLELVELARDGQAMNLEAPYPHFANGDSLRVRGPLERVLELATRDGLELHKPEDRKADSTGQASSEPSLPGSQSEKTEAMTESSSGDNRPAEALPPENPKSKLTLAEVVVLFNSGLIGRTLKAVRFSEVYDAIVLALRRQGQVSGRPSTTPLRAGDVLVVEGKPGALKALAATRGFLVIGTPSPPEEKKGKILITLLTLVAVVALAAFGVLPIVKAATAGCAVLMLTGCLRPREAYQAIDLSIVFLLAGALALGLALEKTHVTTALANLLANLEGVTSPFFIMAGFFVIAMLISEFMSNSGTVTLLAPIALSLAAKMGMNPMALLAAITFGASAAFAMPIGYQTSLMIYGPGGYRFKDFLRMGLALDLLLAIIALWLIPRFWPLAAQ